MAKPNSARAADAAEPIAAAAPAVPASRIVALGTVVELEIDDPLSSKTNKEGDFFHLHLVDPIVRDGVILVPGGTTGMGQVTFAERSGIGGKPGKLIIAARYLEYGGTRLPLGHFHFGKVGQDNTNAALVVSMAFGLPGLFVTGGEVNVTVGARANARLTADVNLPAAQASVSAAPSESVTTTGEIKP